MLTWWMHWKFMQSYVGAERYHSHRLKVILWYRNKSTFIEGGLWIFLRHHESEIVIDTAEIATSRLGYCVSNPTPELFDIIGADTKSWCHRFSVSNNICYRLQYWLWSWSRPTHLSSITCPCLPRLCPAWWQQCYWNHTRPRRAGGCSQQSRIV